MSSLNIFSPFYGSHYSRNSAHIGTGVSSYSTTTTGFIQRPLKEVTNRNCGNGIRTRNLYLMRVLSCLLLYPAILIY